MPAIVPLIIGTAAYVGGRMAAKKLAPKPQPQTATPTPILGPTPPDTTRLNSDAQAAALQAGMKQRKRAKGGGILGPKPGGLLGASGIPSLQPKALIGGTY